MNFRRYPCIRIRSRRARVAIFSKCARAYVRSCDGASRLVSLAHDIAFQVVFASSSIRMPHKRSRELTETSAQPRKVHSSKTQISLEKTILDNKARRSDYRLRAASRRVASAWQLFVLPNRPRGHDIIMASCGGAASPEVAYNPVGNLKADSPEVAYNPVGNLKADSP
ncbi:hypothetical protein EVAR_29654_1 [Eumeta japonica]|uniref:Uncharacterized protein n=1 Tax=Eumeta variegata TaxID=151549 RepID=A0A4C1W7K2_EUMVA|nr:hypothetical protein EVAR_29654_1 [Eumeta japonica]